MNNSNTMSVRKSVFVLFFTISCLGSSCCKKAPKTTVYLPEEFLSYVSFPVGSWWVYQKINTTEIDSVYVLSFNQWIEDETSVNPDYSYEEFAFTLKSSFFNATTYWGGRPRKNGSTFMYYLEEVYNENNSTYNDDRFFYPFSQQSTYGELEVKNVLDTITINNISFTNIIVFNNISQSYKIKTEYYCKSIGVIRREYADGTVWEITKYQIK